MKADAALRHIPVIMISAIDEIDSVIRCIELGAEDYLPKPFNPTLLRARVGACLERKRLHDQVAAQAADLAAGIGCSRRASSSSSAEIERVSRLKRFLSPQVAELILSAGDERVLDSHRTAITVLFCDLRGFTAFSETAEPEEVMVVLRDYHAVLGALIHKHRRHRRTLRRRRHHGAVQRSAAVSGPEPAGGAHGGRDARAGRQAWRRNGASRASSSVSGSAWRTATPRSAASASRAATTMELWARW